RQSFRPEFLNRIDETILFTPLNRKEIKKVVELQLKRLEDRLESANIQLKATPDAIQYLADKGYDPQYGARPVKRVIQKQVLNSLSKALLSGDVDSSAAVVMDVFDDQVVFRKEIAEEDLIAIN
ncbi:MAG: type VI secretion system ATPase TssH, partial [Flavobacteriales bacterium]|nr:type VI secretion system ATPase TssH [Flavobacteriales bacterium]